jgi:uncharacterized protein YecT (DUF1311 family)
VRQNSNHMLVHRIILAALMVIVLAASASAQNSATKISEAEIKAVIDEGSQCEKLDEIYVGHSEYFDFNGDGADEAVVVASTCNTGTAGPDIHAVYTRDVAGKIVELPLPHLEDPPQGQKLPVFGNPNYGFVVEQGQLVARWMDSSERKAPLVVWYKWDGKAFVVGHMKVEGPFPTSYDCAKASKEMDRAICYAPTVAPLDLELGKIYRARMRQLPPDKKQALQGEQRQWLAQREKQCVIYKWWVDCLKELYNKRIAELSKP